MFEQNNGIWLLCTSENWKLKILKILAFFLKRKVVPGFNSVWDVAFTDKRTRVKDLFSYKITFQLLLKHIFHYTNCTCVILLSLTSFNIRNTLLSRKILVVLSQKRETIPNNTVPLNLCGNEQTETSVLQDYYIVESGKKDQLYWWELSRISLWFIHLSASLCVYNKGKVAWKRKC